MILIPTIMPIISTIIIMIIVHTFLPRHKVITSDAVAAAVMSLMSDTGGQIKRSFPVLSQEDDC